MYGSCKSKAILTTCNSTLVYAIIEHPSPKTMNVLKPYAFKNEDAHTTKKLRHDDSRTAFMRDEGTIKFKMKEHQRMRGKSQVFPSYINDHFRTRATHTDQVAYLAETISHEMGLNMKLAEVIALAHDLGHTPFGHKGEVILDEIMQEKGYDGFDHNNQSYEICKRWGLSEEVLEGLKKHSSPHDPLTKRFLNDGKKPLLEAQVVDLADEIAYTAHDLEDGLRSGILKIEDVKKLKIWKRAEGIIEDPKDPIKYIQESVSAIVRILAKDMVKESEKAIETNNIKSVDDVRNSEHKLIRHSEEILGELKEAREFLMENFYKHSKVVNALKMADAIIKPLFEYYIENPKNMNSQNKMKRLEDGEDKILVVKDFVVGMTDQFAIDEAIKHNIITQQKVDEMSQM